MIDITKPLELEDGTPVNYVFSDAAGDYDVLVNPDDDPRYPSIKARRSFYANGKHIYGVVPNLRNIREPVQLQDDSKHLPEWGIF